MVFDTVSQKARRGLVFMSFMRLITISQFAISSGLSHKYAGDFLHNHSKRNFLGTCGDAALAGGGHAPKVYYITRKGWDFYTSEELIDLYPFVHAKPHQNWSQGMQHRLKTVDISQGLEAGLQKSGAGILKESRFDFKTVNSGGKSRKETADDISNNLTIIPDAAFLVERTDQARALIFLETDMGTEPICEGASQTTVSLERKFQNYEAYYQSGCFRERYAEWGDFESFLVLFVTTDNARINRIRSELGSSEQPLDRLFLLSSHNEVERDACDAIWYSRYSGKNARTSFLAV